MTFCLPRPPRERRARGEFWIYVRGVLLFGAVVGAAFAMAHAAAEMAR